MKLSSKTGLPPGTPVYTGERDPEDTGIEIIFYNDEEYEVRTGAGAGDLKEISGRPGQKWIKVTGLGNTSLIEEICNIAGIHPLTLEDLINTSQRPKIESFDDYLYIVIRILIPEEEGYYSEQASLILFRDTLFTFLEHDSPVFDPVGKRLETTKSRIRKYGADYLLYAVIDAAVDAYFSIFETIGERLEDIEETVIDSPEPQTLENIYSVRRDLIYLRKSIWPLRDVIASFLRGEHDDLMGEHTGIFMRDVYDHLIQISETLETYRDLASGLLDIYLSGASNRMNEVMKVLTIIATIFIPLTFIAGLYGMNFRYMPELDHPLAYPAVLILMAAIAITMVLYFRRKGWL